MKPLEADIALGHVQVEVQDGDEVHLEKVPVAVACIIHEDGQMVWESDPISMGPLGPFGLDLAGAVIKDLHNEMRRSKEWKEVWRATDWTVLGKLASRRKVTRAALK